MELTSNQKQTLTSAQLKYLSFMREVFGSKVSLNKQNFYNRINEVLKARNQRRLQTGKPQIQVSAEKIYQAFFKEEMVKEILNGVHIERLIN